MKKYLSFAVTAMAILGLGSLTSCHDEDFDVSTAVLQERAFEQSFIKEFGQPSADQSWDFYAQKMEALGGGAGLTRATQAISKGQQTNQPIGQTYFDNIVRDVKYTLEDEHNNFAVGQNSYTLTSTGNFKIYAVLYQGWYTQESGHNFDFGIMYNGRKISLFGPINVNPNASNPTYYKIDANGDRVPCEKGDPINPGGTINAAGDSIPVAGFGYEINSTAGDQFYFYMSLYVDGSTYTYYSNSSTYYKGNSRLTLKDKYEIEPAGPSVLVYSTEINVQAQGNKQIMMIGFEDGFSGNADADYNDIVIVLEGNLPEPTSKRFFCEDKESFDWDYNDVVFDVSNYGITLRAVGGTLPVFLRVKEKGKNSYRVVGMKNEGKSGEPDYGKTFYELHELMRSQQYQTDVTGKPNEHKDAQLTYTKDGKTYYRPIDVGADPQSLWLDPVLIVDWLNTTSKLTDDEVKNFANPLATNKVGDIELVVLPQSQYSSTGYDPDEIASLQAFTSPGDDTEAPKIIQMAQVGKVPAIWSSPVSVMWMKELKKITLGYKNFYGAGTSNDVYGYQWWENNVDRSYMYDYTGDGKDVYVP